MGYFCPKLVNKCDKRYCSGLWSGNVVGLKGENPINMSPGDLITSPFDENALGTIVHVSGSIYSVMWYSKPKYWLGPTGSLGI